MKKFFHILTLLLTAAVVCGKETPKLRLLDASGGAAVGVFQSAGIMLAMQGNMEISMRREVPSAALKMLDENKVDAVICERRFAGNRPVIPLGAEALALYVSVVNPVDGLKAENVVEILTAVRPTWKNYNHLDLDIQRIMIKSRTPEGTLVERIFVGSKLAEEIFTVRSQSAGYAFTNTASLFFAPFVPLPPGDLKMLKINGIAPTSASVVSGEYPFAMRYVIVRSRREVPALEEMIKFISGSAEYRRQMQDSGLIVQLP